MGIYINKKIYFYYYCQIVAAAKTYIGLDLLLLLYSLYGGGVAAA